MHPEDLFRVLGPALDEVSNGVTIADARRDDLPLVFVNRAFEKVTGYSPEESLGSNCRFLQGPSTDPRAVQEIRAALRQGEPCHVCLRNYRKDGTAFLNELKILPIIGEDGGADFFIGVQNDVTAQLLARVLRGQDSTPALGPTDWRVEHLGFSLSIDPPISQPWGGETGVLVTDHRGRLRYANRAASSLLSKAPAELPDTHLFDHFDADWLSDALRPGAQVEHEWLRVRCTGSPDRVRSAELSTYRVSPDLSTNNFYVVLVRAVQKGIDRVRE